MNQPIVKIENGKPMTTSVAVAEYFQREHRSVLDSIRTILADVSEPFRLQNFLQSEYLNKQNHLQPCYVMTRSGFAMTALGFTGTKAVQFREAYITRFDEMEAKLMEKQLKQLEHQYVKEKYLPFDEPVIRASVPLSDAVKHLHILHLYPEMTTTRLKGMITRGEIEGHKDSRGYTRIYEDQVTKLATGH